jgi:hypothetical protein
VADPERGSVCVPLRKPIGALLTDRRTGVRLPVTIVALAADTLRFITDRSLPPGSTWTIIVRRLPPLSLSATLRSTRAYERDTFACEAVLGPLREPERSRFDALVPREPAAEWV